jgi:hypothetical protein
MLDKKVSAHQCQYKHKNILPVGMVTMETDNIEDKQRWMHDSIIDPTLQLDSSRAALRKLIYDALAGTRSAQALPKV